MNRKTSLYTGLGLMLLAFICAFILNLPTAGSKTIRFQSSYKNKPVTLQGSFSEVDGAEYAALICPGYSCDRQKWRPLSDLLVGNGITTLSFDYSGQGASMGTIGFDNANTDAIPTQIADAIEELHRLSGIPYDHIILVGHSMGGRSIVRLLYDYNCETAETTVQKRDIANVILLAPEVNYEYSAQASLFAGTSDSEREPWKSYNESYVKGVNVYLYGSTADDIVSDGDVLALYAHMGGRNAPASGTCLVSETTAAGSRVTVGILSGVLHSYEMYSPRFGALINDALTEITGKPSAYRAAGLSLVYISWFAALAGVFFSLWGLTGMTAGTETAETLPVLTDAKAFLIRKILLWIPGIIAAFLICCLCVAMPFGSPVMNIPYMCFIAGYGFVMLFAYRKGTFPGVSGKLPAMHFHTNASRRDLTVTASVFAGLCFFVWYVLRATMYRLIPLNARLFWVCVAAIMMTVAYYVSGCENDMLDKAFADNNFDTKAGLRIRILYNLIQYVPLLLLVLFYAVLKSYSGMIGQIQNMVLMYIFCIPLGNYVRKKIGLRIMGALLTGFLLQTLMITSAALISFF